MTRSFPLVSSLVVTFICVSAGCAGTNQALEGAAVPLPMTQPGAANDNVPAPTSLSTQAISTSNWEANQRTALAPLCDVRAGAAPADPKKIAAINAELAGWSAQRPKDVAKEAAQAEAVREHKAISVGGNAKIKLDTFAFDCGAAPHLTLNGQTYAGDTIYAAFSNANGTRRMVFQVISWKTGLLAGATLYQNTAPSGFATGGAASTDVHVYLSAQPGEPLVIWDNGDYLATYLAPKGATSGIYFVAPFKPSTGSDYAVGVNKFVVQDK